VNAEITGEIPHIDGGQSPSRAVSSLQARAARAKNRLCLPTESPGFFGALGDAARRAYRSLNA
jgi:hypothetical protein